MEDIRSYRTEDENQWQLPKDERTEWIAATDDEPPFHIPRD